MTMRAFIASASMTGALLSAGASPAWADGETLILELYGEHAWQVSCTLIQSNGDIINAEDSSPGGMATGRIAARDVVTGHCRYETGQNAILRVTLRTEMTSFECPFLYVDGEECRTYFAGEAEGGFSIGASVPVGSAS